MDEMRSQVSNRYELSWTGPCEPFRAALQSAGVEFADPADSGQSKVMVTIQDGFNIRTLFELARGTGAVLTEIKPDEENLERLFFRVTEQATPV